MESGFAIIERFFSCEFGDRACMTYIEELLHDRERNSIGSKGVSSIGLNSILLGLEKHIAGRPSSMLPSVCTKFPFWYIFESAMITTWKTN